jgi:hypothetical protein
MYLVNQVKSSFTCSFPSEPYAPLGLPVPFVGAGSEREEITGASPSDNEAPRRGV